MNNTIPPNVFDNRGWFKMLGIGPFINMAAMLLVVMFSYKPKEQNGFVIHICFITSRSLHGITDMCMFCPVQNNFISD